MDKWRLEKKQFEEEMYDAEEQFPILTAQPSMTNLVTESTSINRGISQDTRIGAN